VVSVAQLSKYTVPVLHKFTGFTALHYLPGIENDDLVKVHNVFQAMHDRKYSAILERRANDILDDDVRLWVDVCRWFVEYGEFTSTEQGTRHREKL
jgi:hypothetical protein